MIFITLGSQKFQFDRLLRAMDDLAAGADIRYLCADRLEYLYP